LIHKWLNGKISNNIFEHALINMNIVDFFQYSHFINKINVDDFNNLPFHFQIWQKDLEGRYINCNDRLAIDAGFNNKNDIIGLTDLDNKMLLRKCTHNFQRNDQNVITTKQAQFFTEPLYFTNRKKLLALSQKVPLILENKITGSMGFAIIIKTNAIADIFSTLLNFSRPIDYNLTQREMEIVKQLAKGYTAKEIARSLDISSRTVEQHTNSIKIKLGVTRKQQIIDKMISLLSDP